MKICWKYVEKSDCLIVFFQKKETHLKIISYSLDLPGFPWFSLCLYRRYLQCPKSAKKSVSHHGSVNQPEAKPLCVAEQKERYISVCMCLSLSFFTLPGLLASAGVISVCEFEWVVHARMIYSVQSRCCFCLLVRCESRTSCQLDATSRRAEKKKKTGGQRSLTMN